MRTLLAAVALLSVALAGVGCSGGTHSLVGKWTADAGTVPVTFDFKTDGTYTLVARMSGGTLTQSGGYKVADNKLTMTVTDTDISTPMRAQPTDQKPKQGIGEVKTMDIQFTSDNDVALSGPLAPGAQSTAINLKRSTQ